MYALAQERVLIALDKTLEQGFKWLYGNFIFAKHIYS